MTSARQRLAAIANATPATTETAETTVCGYCGVEHDDSVVHGETEETQATALTASTETEATRTARTQAHTLVGHTSPDIECNLGIFALEHIPIFKVALNIGDNPKLKFIPAGPLRKEDWEALGFTKRVTGPELEALGYRGFDCMGGELDQHGKLDILQQQFASLDLLVLAAGVTDSPEYTAVLKYIFELVSRNDLTAEDIVQDHHVKSGKWPHTQRTLRNFVTALNLLHPKRPDVVVKVMNLAFMGLITYVEEAFDAAAEAHRQRFLTEGVEVRTAYEAAQAAYTAARRQAVTDGTDPDETVKRHTFFKGIDFDLLSDELPEETKVKIARSGFLMENILEGLTVLGEDVRAKFVREYEAAFDLYEAEWVAGERDYYDPAKTQVFSGVQMRCVDEKTLEVIYRPITVAVTISASERIGAVCRRGNWSKDRGKSREDQNAPARRGADVVLHFQTGNQRKFTISTRHILLNDVAAVIRTADLLAAGVRRLSADQIRSFVNPGHIAVPNGSETLQVLYLAEFGKAFGHLRSNPYSRPTALSKKMIEELLFRALNEGLSRALVEDVLDGRILR